MVLEFIERIVEDVVLFTKNFSKVIIEQAEVANVGITDDTIYVSVIELVDLNTVREELIKALPNFTFDGKYTFTARKNSIESENLIEQTKEVSVELGDHNGNIKITTSGIVVNGITIPFYKLIKLTDIIN